MASSPDVKVTFDAALDGGGWPGPLAQAGGVVYGSTWVGPLGLVDLLEKRLGLGGRFDGPLERACRLVPKLSRLDGHWSKSFAVDPLATSRRLLRQRDELRCFGWTGQSFSARLGELNVATTDASVGIPDRLEAIARALPAHPAGIEHLASFTPIAHLTPVWRAVFAALTRAGVTVEEQTIEAVASAGDLASARQRAFLPRGDGRICLLRRHGPLEVADEIAAYLAAWDSLDGVVVVAPDAVLDTALARHGVPRLGANAGAPASTRLLCLVVEAAFRPMEMCDLHALLAAEPGPIPKAMAVNLMAVLGRWPGRGSPEWKEALAPAPPADADADADKDAQRRENVRQRAELLASPVCARSGRLPISDLRARLQALDAWARSRAPFVPSLAELSRQIETLLDTVELMGADSLSWHELRRLCEEIGESTWSWAPADAGLACVSNPGAVLAPARAVIWWDFSRDRAPSRMTLRLTPAELAGFGSAGLVPPDPTLATQVLAAGWRRPLTQATEALVLACPATSSGGEANYPHPLWDEITASLENHRDARKLERRQLGFPVRARTVPIAQRSLVVASETIEARAPLLLRDSESPSSLEKLMGCSLSWALHYRARLRSGFSAGPAAPRQLLFGLLAHRLLAQVWGCGDGSPDAAAAAAGSLFDQQCDDLCEELGLPQHQSARATLRRAVVESARELVRLATKYGAVRTKTEVAVGAVVLDQRFEGRMDLLWEDLGVIVDLKWGKGTPERLLETGTAVQLAAYGAMWQQGGEGYGQNTVSTEVHRQGQTQFPETAYFCLQTQELLTEPGSRFGTDGKVCGNHTASHMWAGVRTAFTRSRDALAAGRLQATGVVEDPPVPGLSPAGLVVSPPCKYCDFSALCGLRGAR